MKKQRLEKHLKSHGCYLLRQGKHEYWYNSDCLRGIGVPRQKEIKGHTVQSICANLGIPVPDEK